MCMCQPYIESANTRSDYVEESQGNSIFVWLRKGNTGPRNVTVDLKYDVLCL